MPPQESRSTTNAPGRPRRSSSTASVISTSSPRAPAPASSSDRPPVTRTAPRAAPSSCLPFVLRAQRNSPWTRRSMSLFVTWTEWSLFTRFPPQRTGHHLTSIVSWFHMPVAKRRNRERPAPPRCRRATPQCDRDLPAAANRSFDAAMTRKKGRSEDQAERLIGPDALRGGLTSSRRPPRSAPFRAPGPTVGAPRRARCRR
jgi:hypothetical protein